METTTSKNIEGNGTPDTLLVGPGCRWVRPPRGTWQDFRRRRSLRLIMSALVGTRDDGLPCDLEALRHAAWRGEWIEYHAARNRVHVALAELRRRGLREAIVRTEDGYVINPNIVIEVVEDVPCVA